MAYAGPVSSIRGGHSTLTGIIENEQEPSFLRISWRGRRGSEWADHQAFAGHGHDIGRDRRQLIDLDDTFDLSEESLGQSEVASREARDRRQDLVIGGAAHLEPQAELVRVPLNDDLEFVPAQRPEVMHETHTRVQGP